MMTSSTAKPERNEELNPFAIAQRQCDNAARYLPAIEPGLFEFLKRPDKLTIVEFPVATSSGKVQNFVGYRCIHMRIPLMWNAESGDLERGFRRSGTLVGAQRRLVSQ